MKKSFMVFGLLAVTAFLLAPICARAESDNPCLEALPGEAAEKASIDGGVIVMDYGMMMTPPKPGLLSLYILGITKITYPLSKAPLIVRVFSGERELVPFSDVVGSAGGCLNAAYEAKVEYDKWVNYDCDKVDVRQRAGCVFNKGAAIKEYDKWVAANYQTANCTFIAYDESRIGEVAELLKYTGGLEEGSQFLSLLGTFNNAGLNQDTQLVIMAKDPQGVEIAVSPQFAMKNMTVDLGEVLYMMLTQKMECAQANAETQIEKLEASGEDPSKLEEYKKAYAFLGDAREYLTNMNDYDTDKIAAGSDNCLSRNNPDQLDTDGDGLGDACDPVTTEPLVTLNNQVITKFKKGTTTTDPAAVTPDTPAGPADPIKATNKADAGKGGECALVAVPASFASIVYPLVLFGISAGSMLVGRRKRA